MVSKTMRHGYARLRLGYQQAKASTPSWYRITKAKGEGMTIEMTHEQAHHLQNLCDLVLDDVKALPSVKIHGIDLHERIAGRLLEIRDSIPCGCGEDEHA